MTRETQLLRFADVEFDVKAGELRRAGVTTRLEPQPARVLALLVERAGDVVTRTELQQHVWSGDTFVDFERGLNYCIAQIRTALGDSATSPRFIETLPRRGYRFIASAAAAAPGAPAASVASVAPSEPFVPAGSDAPTGFVAPAPSAPLASAAPRLLRAVVVIALGVLALSIAGVFLAWTVAMRRMERVVSSPSTASSPSTPSKSSAAVAPRSGPVRIAVALFDNETKRPDYDQLAQTLTDAVTARLAADPSRLTVIGNAPILRQARSFRDVTTIGAALGTEHVIIGQVQEIAGRLRVTAHLIRAADQGHVWAQPLRADRERHAHARSHGRRCGGGRRRVETARTVTVAAFVRAVLTPS